MHQISERTLKWVEDQLEGEVKGQSTLPGGTSSQMTLLEIKRDKTSEEVILREYTNEDWLETEPQIAFQEAMNLKQAKKAAVKTPNCLGVDGDAVRTTHPSLLMSKLEGHVDLKPKKFSEWLDQLATALTAVHQVQATRIENRYFRYFNPNQAVHAKWSSCPDEWKYAFTLLKKQPDFTPSFIHRDFHPVNVLFDKQKVAGVVDWTNACIGPKESDVGHCRWNLAMMYGQDAAELFLKAYIHENPDFKYDSYWDLEALGNVFTEEKPAVYEGWPAFGLTHLTPDLLVLRMDNMLINALEKNPAFFNKD